MENKDTEYIEGDDLDFLHFLFSEEPKETQKRAYLVLNDIDC